MDLSDRIDEGYSEGGRSQEDANSPEKILEEDTSFANQQSAYITNLRNAVLELGEQDRKGMISH